MKILLIRPDPGNERFGLGPFFRVEPLGLEYIGAELLRRGHETEIVDARFEPAVARRARRLGPALVGISGMHALEYDQVLAAARAVRRVAPDAFIVAGGHAAAAYSDPLETAELDAICTDDGEEIFPALADALDANRPPATVPGLRLRRGNGWTATGPVEDRPALDAVPLPARELVGRYRNRYHCLLFKPVWLIETARGCPFRCSFCSVWQLYGRSFRERAIGTVADDFESAGENVFVVDDLFWNHPDRSRALARELKRRGVRKRWMLVQTRTDLVCRHPDLLTEWRPLAKDFDIFFGLEAASDSALRGVTKDATANQSVEAARLARGLAFGVTGNFLVDPDWEEEDFRELWDFVATHGFQRAGYTILTPLPGTELFRRAEDRLRGQPWFKFDMSHVLWEPRLGARRFFELYAETWQRSILNTAGEKRWIDWVRQVRPSQVPYLLRVLARTQRMMRPEAYLREHGERSSGSAAVVGGPVIEGA
ncbi:MAG TPA: radical SAM protein [Thermoanaerobaculia bacterium]|nr:radical SAM protein [Thermoanaerobaculia bacterium]